MGMKGATRSYRSSGKGLWKESGVAISYSCLMLDSKRRTEIERLLTIRGQLLRPREDTITRAYGAASTFGKI